MGTELPTQMDFQRQPRESSSQKNAPMSEPNIHSEPEAQSLTRTFTSRALARARRAAGYTVCGLLLQGPAQAHEPPSPDPAACSVGRANALSEVACELRKQLPLAQPTLVVAATPTADAPLTDPARLAGRIASVVAAGLGASVKSHPVDASLGAAQLAAAKLGALLYLEPEISGGRLRLVANLYPIARSFWDRVRDPHPNPSAHAFAERPLDPELRSFFAAVPLVASSTTLASPPERAPVALACGDADDDGSYEVAFVGRRRLALGRFRGDRFVATAAKEWVELSPVAPAPLREPVAGVRIRQGAGLDVGLSDRANFVRLDATLQPTASASRRIPHAGGCLDLVGHRLQPKLVRCVADDPAPGAYPVLSLDGAVASTSLLSTDGTPVTYVAAYQATDDSIVVTSGGKALARVTEAGGQLALADLDGDGSPELLSSRATLDPRTDALLVHTVAPDGTLSERLRIPVPDGITAIAACTPGTKTMAPIVVGTRARLWVIQ